MSNGEEKTAVGDGTSDAPEAEAEAASADPTETAAEASAGGGEVEDEVEMAETGPHAAGELSVMDALEKRVEALEGENKETYERLLRTTADLDNLRKRSRREIQDTRVDSQARVLRDVLPVIDNLGRALEHAGEATEGNKGIIDGVKLVVRQFEQALEKNSVKAIEALDQSFDPNLHEAMSQVETAEAAAGSVVQVLQTGYVIGERLLRPALVVVAKAPPAPEPAAGSNGKSKEVAGDESADEAAAEPEAPDTAADDDAATGGEISESAEPTDSDDDL